MSERQEMLNVPDPEWEPKSQQPEGKPSEKQPELHLPIPHQRIPEIPIPNDRNDPRIPKKENPAQRGVIEMDIGGNMDISGEDASGKDYSGDPI